MIIVKHIPFVQTKHSRGGCTISCHTCMLTARCFASPHHVNSASWCHCPMLANTFGLSFHLFGIFNTLKAIYTAKTKARLSLARDEVIIALDIALAITSEFSPVFTTSDIHALKQELPYKRSLDPKISTGRAAVLD